MPELNRVNSSLPQNVRSNAAQPRWTLITVTFNSADVLTHHWTGAGIPEDVEWVVVDNNSSDRSAEIARELGAVVIALDENVGFSAANNIAFHSTTTEFVAFVNPDVTVDWCSLPDLEAHALHSGGLVAPQLLNPDGSPQTNGRGAPALTSKVLHRLLPHAAHSRYRVFAGRGELRFVSWVIGAAIAGKRETFQALKGPWDSHFFLYYEDSDICLRAWRQNIPVILVGDAQWLHSWARETTKLAWEPWKREISAMMKFYARYPWLILGVIPPRNSKSYRRLWSEQKAATTYDLKSQYARE